MECVKCGHEIVKGAKFCTFCGEKVVREEPEEEKPIYTTDVKGMLKSGRLAVYHDRVEFITSSIQKTVFNYSALMAVKKGLDRILFITEDGRTESCSVNMKNIHEAFLYIEKASRPYIAERKDILLSKGIQYSLVSNMGLVGGILNILDDRAEFKAKSGQSETICFKDVKSVGISMGMLEFSLIDGKTKTFSVDKDIRDEVLSFLEKAVAPYIAERKEALLARGIYYSSFSSCGSSSGTLDILEDRVEYKAKSGHSESVFYRDVRTVRLSMGTLELSLTNGMSRSFAVDKDISEEVFSFVEKAVRPYMMERTAGFETVFGIDERIEINEARGVFHILRQGGNVITGECPIGDIVKCEWTESSEPGSVLGGVLSGGMAILNGVVKNAGTQGASKESEKISYVGVLLTIRTDQGVRTECIRFGDFPLGTSRANKKYEKYTEEISKFMDYLGSHCLECERIMPALPEIKNEPLRIGMSAAGEEQEVTDAADNAAKKDQFGIIKYIEGVSEFIDECTAPMTIAIQGSWGSGKNSIMKMLSGNLEESSKRNLIWFNTWQFSQFDLGEQLPMLVGNRLISQLNGTNNAVKKDRAIKAAKGLINITSGFISQGSTDGQNLMDALFRDNSADSLEKLVGNFSALVRKRSGGENNKVIIFIEDLDRLTPAKGVELLEAMRNFFDCEGCVFVVAVDYDSVLRGAKERYGQDFDDERGKSYFDKMFQVSFRVPVSSFNIQNYVKDKLEQMGIHDGDEEEIEFYAGLIRCSVGSEPKSMDRLFNSFLLLKKLAGAKIYESKYRRLMLFALICMQTKYRDIYDFIVRIKDKVTPDFLSGLCSEQSEVLENSRLSDDEKAEFGDFAKIFCDIINTDKKEDISESECGVFAEVLEFSSITSK